MDRDCDSHAMVRRAYNGSDPCHAACSVCFSWVGDRPCSLSLGPPQMQTPTSLSTGCILACLATRCFLSSLGPRSLGSSLRGAKERAEQCKEPAVTAQSM